MKKLILIALLIACSLIAKEYTTVNLNIKYKGKVYKNYECKIVKMIENRAQIITNANKVIWVQVGNSSIQTALDGLKTAKQREKDTIKINQLPINSYKLVSGLAMFQNMTEKGALVNYYYWGYGPTPRYARGLVTKGSQAAAYFHLRKQSQQKSSTLIYIVDPIEVADGSRINMTSLRRDKIFKSTNSEYILYNIGLHRYNTTFGMKTVQKYTTQYSTYQKYMKNE